MNRGSQEDILTPGEVGVEARPQFEHGGDGSAGLDHPGLRRQDPGQHLEEGALPGPVTANDPNRLAWCDIEIDVSQRPEF